MSSRAESDNDQEETPAVEETVNEKQPDESEEINQDVVDDLEEIGIESTPQMLRQVSNPKSIGSTSSASSKNASPKKQKRTSMSKRPVKEEVATKAVSTNKRMGIMPVSVPMESRRKTPTKITPLAKGDSKTSKTHTPKKPDPKTSKKTPSPKKPHQKTSETTPEKLSRSDTFFDDLVKAKNILAAAKKKSAESPAKTRTSPRKENPKEVAKHELPEPVCTIPPDDPSRMEASEVEVSNNLIAFPSYLKKRFPEGCRYGFVETNVVLRVHNRAIGGFCHGEQLDRARFGGKYFRLGDIVCEVGGSNVQGRIIEVVQIAGEKGVWHRIHWRGNRDNRIYGNVYYCDDSLRYSQEKPRVIDERYIKPEKDENDGLKGKRPVKKSQRLAVVQYINGWTESECSSLIPYDTVGLDGVYYSVTNNDLSNRCIWGIQAGKRGDRKTAKVFAIEPDRPLDEQDSAAIYWERMCPKEELAHGVKAYFKQKNAVEKKAGRRHKVAKFQLESTRSPMTKAELCSKTSKSKTLKKRAISTANTFDNRNPSRAPAIKKSPAMRKILNQPSAGSNLNVKGSSSSAASTNSKRMGATSASPGFTPQRSNSREHDNRSPRMKSVKQFMADQDDNISEDDAFRRYTIYKEEFQAQQKVKKEQCATSHSSEQINQWIDGVGGEPKIPQSTIADMAASIQKSVLESLTSQLGFTISPFSTATVPPGSVANVQPTTPSAVRPTTTSYSDLYKSQHSQQDSTDGFPRTAWNMQLYRDWWLSSGRLLGFPPPQSPAFTPSPGDPSLMNVGLYGPFASLNSPHLESVAVKSEETVVDVVSVDKNAGTTVQHFTRSPTRTSPRKVNTTSSPVKVQSTRSPLPSPQQRKRAPARPNVKIGPVSLPTTRVTRQTSQAKNSKPMQQQQDPSIMVSSSPRKSPRSSSPLHLRLDLGKVTSIMENVPTGKSDKTTARSSKVEKPVDRKRKGQAYVKPPGIPPVDNVSANLETPPPERKRRRVALRKQEDEVGGSSDSDVIMFSDHDLPKKKLKVEMPSPSILTKDTDRRRSSQRMAIRRYHNDDKDDNTPMYPPDDGYLDDKIVPGERTIDQHRRIRKECKSKGISDKKYFTNETADLEWERVCNSQNKSSPQSKVNSFFYQLMLRVFEDGIEGYRPQDGKRYFLDWIRSFYRALIYMKAIVAAKPGDATPVPVLHHLAAMHIPWVSQAVTYLKQEVANKADIPTDDNWILHMVTHTRNNFNKRYWEIIRKHKIRLLTKLVSSPDNNIAMKAATELARLTGKQVQIPAQSTSGRGGDDLAPGNDSRKRARNPESSSISFPKATVKSPVQTTSGVQSRRGGDRQSHSQNFPKATVTSPVQTGGVQSRRGGDRQSRSIIKLAITAVVSPVTKIRKPSTRTKPDRVVQPSAINVMFPDDDDDEYESPEYEGVVIEEDDELSSSEGGRDGDESSDGDDDEDVDPILEELQERRTRKK